MRSQTLSWMLCSMAVSTRLKLRAHRLGSYTSTVFVNVMKVFLWFWAIIVFFSLYFKANQWENQNSIIKTYNFDSVGKHVPWFMKFRVYPGFRNEKKLVNRREHCLSKCQGSRSMQWPCSFSSSGITERWGLKIEIKTSFPIRIKRMLLSFHLQIYIFFNPLTSVRSSVFVYYRYLSKDNPE